PDGPRDEQIRLLSLLDGGGELVGILWSYACHPVCFPDWDLVSADFPGVVRRELRARFGNIPIVYWQGFSVDTRPYLYRTRGAAGRREMFVKFSQADWEAWAGSLADAVAAVAASSGKVIEGQIKATRHGMSLEELGVVAPGRGLAAHELRIGSELSIFGVSAE